MNTKQMNEYDTVREIATQAIRELLAARTGLPPTDDDVAKEYAARAEDARRFKDWSKRKFSSDDVTWCEVRAEVNRLIELHAPARGAEAVRVAQPGTETMEKALKQIRDECAKPSIFGLGRTALYDIAVCRSIRAEQRAKA